MAGRRVLVVGSGRAPLAELAPLPFVQDCATELLGVLEQDGGWSPAVGDGLVADPTVAEARSALTQAFENAAERQATLLVALLGHGVSVGEEFYFMTVDAPADPGPESALPVVSLVGSLIESAEDLDGLIVLVDACEADSVRAAMGRRWVDVLGARRGRMDLLVASGDDAAYGGCFTKTLLELFDTGLPDRGDGLVCADLLPTITSKCRSQAPQQQSYSNAVITSADRSLTLVPNAARRRDALHHRPGAGVVDQLTHPDALVLTSEIRRALQALQPSVIGAPGSARLQVVRGPAGCGKSTLLALLLRPEVNEGVKQVLTHRSDGVKAAVFLDSSSTPDGFAEEVAEQLTRTVVADQIGDRPAFGTVSQQVDADLDDLQRTQLSTWQQKVVLPLARLHPEVAIPIIIDGLDQPEPGAAELIAAAMTELSGTAGCEQVRVITGIRPGDAYEPLLALLPQAQTLPVAAPTSAEIAEALRRRLRASAPGLDADQLSELLAADPAGGWVLARLLADLAARTLTTDTNTDALTPTWLHDQVSLEELITARITLALDPGHIGDPELTQQILALCTAAGVGPVLPIQLIAAALAPRDAKPLSLPRIRNCLPAHGALLARGRPGTNHETLGLAHDLYQIPATRHLNTTDTALDWAHHRIITTALANKDVDAINAYWHTAAPHHYLAVDAPAEAINHLQSLDTGRAGDNRDRWASWLPAFTAKLGPDHPSTLTTRSNLADWRGEAGDVSHAVDEYEALLADQLRVLGPDHPDTLTTRHNLAGWIGNAGDVAGAIGGFEALLADQLRALGPDHPDTLKTRNQLAGWRGKAGDVSHAVDEFEALLADQLRVLGASHRDTLSTRSNLAHSRAEAGDNAGAVDDYEVLLRDWQQVLASDHPDVLTIRNNLAVHRGKAGDVTRAIGEFETLLADRVRLLGPDHPDTLSTRNNLAGWRGAAGDVVGAIGGYEALLTDQLHVLGPNHPATLTTRHNLAGWRGKGGDVSHAVGEFEVLLADRVRVLGPDHPDTLSTRNNLAIQRGEAGDVAGAIGEFEALLAAFVRVLGPKHPDTLTTRSNLANWRARAGGVAGELDEYEVLLADRMRVLGPDHPDTLTARSDLAFRRGEAGDAAGAVGEYEVLLADRMRVLGTDHPETLSTRNNLAGWRGAAGDVVGAIGGYEALLADQLRVLGPDHPDTLTTRHILAGWHGLAGDVVGAIAEFEALLADRVRVLGPKHPATLKTRNNLALWRTRKEGDLSPSSAASSGPAFFGRLGRWRRTLFPIRHNLDDGNG
jgi:tetratricopeptide (TPR) repeat protein